MANHDQPLARERKRQAIAMSTEEFSDLISDAAMLQSIETQENTRTTAEVELRKARVATEVEMKRVQDSLKMELGKAQSTADHSAKEMTTMNENMAAMKTEISSTLKLDMSNMVKEATKESVDATKDKLRGHMKKELNMM
eukprot:12096127-Ditylum_brightwellii.AAC.1